MSTTSVETERSELTIEHVREQVRLMRGLCRNGSYPPPPADVIAAGRVATELDFLFGNRVRLPDTPAHFNPLLDALRALGIALAAPAGVHDSAAFGWSATTITEMLAEMVGLADNDYTGS